MTTRPRATSSRGRGTRTYPQVPKTWEVDIATANSWGPILPEILDH